MRRTGQQNRAIHQHGHLGREAANDMHVVLDHQDRDFARQAVDRIKQDRDFLGRDARRGLVEQENLRLEAERDGDLDEALPAIGNLGNLTMQVFSKAQLLDYRLGSRQQFALSAGGPHHLLADAAMLAYREIDIFKNGQPTEQACDLERANQALFDAVALAAERYVRAHQ